MEVSKETKLVKSVMVTFEFDPTTEEVSNIQCSIDGVEKKKRTTKKKTEVVEELASIPLITLDAAKLVFNNKAVAEMELEYEDRVVIKWDPITPKSKTLIPIIGKDLAFDEEGSGNKVTKSNTVGYKGKQNTILAELGTIFTIEPYKGDIWKLVSTTNPGAVKTIPEAIVESERVEPMLLIDNEDNSEIDETQFQFTVI